MNIVRTGHVNTTKIDNAEMNEEKKKFEEYIIFYKNELSNVATSIKTLEVLTANTEDIYTFKKYCPSFFRVAIYNFWSQCVIGLNECFNGDDYGYGNFFNYVKANWNKIFTAEWEKTTNWSDGTSDVSKIKWNYKNIESRISQAQSILNVEKSAVRKIKTFRDQVFAHVDKDQPDEKLNLKELRQIFTVAEKVFNAIASLYDLSEYCMEPLNSGDVGNLVRIVNQYDKYHDEINQLRRNDMLKQIGQFGKENEE